MFGDTVFFYGYCDLNVCHRVQSVSKEYEVWNMLNLFVFLNNISKECEYLTQFVKKNIVKSANDWYTPVADSYLGGDY